MEIYNGYLRYEFSVHGNSIHYVRYVICKSINELWDIMRTDPNMNIALPDMMITIRTVDLTDEDIIYIRNEEGIEPKTSDNRKSNEFDIDTAIEISKPRNPTSSPLWVSDEFDMVEEVVEIPKPRKPAPSPLYVREHEL